MKPRLLVVELHHLGDAVMSLPFVRGAQRKFEVHVLCRPASRGIYKLAENPPHTHAWNPPWTEDRPCSAWQAVAAARSQGRTLRSLGIDAAACVWADVRAQILMAETRAARRVGFPMTRGNYYAADLSWRRRNRWLGRILESVWQATHPGRPLLTQWLHRASPEQSHARAWEQVAEALSVECDYAVPWIHAPSASKSPGQPKPVLAIHAHARLPSKQWPVDRWTKLLASAEVADHFDLVEILPPGAAAVTAGKARKVETQDLPDLIAVLNGADAALCHDSLPAHLAAALGKPVVTIFGSGEPDWFAPWNNRDRVVQRRVCPMHPCIDRCGMDRYLCLDAIETGDVLAQLRRLSTKA